MPTLVNGYGISEVTVYSTFKEIGAAELRAPTGSIGRPLEGTYVYILDPGGRLCPVGVVGEIHLGGLGVGRGYLGRPDLTARRWVPDPFDPGRTLYRSGDLGRWLETGEIEYLGRADTQVKVRGHRIEIAGLESILAGHPSVGEAVILPTEHAGSGTRLVAFFTARGTADVGALRRYMEEQVAGYMVPARFVGVDRIPVTPNGKVDRRALMARERPAAQDDADRALAPIEGLVRRTWAEVLGLSTGEIGAERCFFELGGDSIGANIVVRALAGHGLPVDIADVFEASTVRDLSRAILAKAPALPPELAPDATGPGGTGIDGGGPDRSRRASFDLPPGALASTAARVEVLARLLAALGTALRMATGASVLRVDLVGHPDLEVGTRRHTAAPVARLALEVGSLGRLAETVGAAHRALRQAATNVFASDIAIARSAGRAGKTAAVALTFADADSGGAGTVEAARREHPAAATPGVRVVASTTAGAIEIAVEGADEAAGDVAPELLLENFGFAWEQALGVAPLPAPAAQPATGRPPSVEPYNDVYYKDCTSHALLTAFRHFGGDPNAVLAGCTSACEVSESASEALRVRVRYLRARPDEDVMREAGVAVDRVAPRGRLVEALIALLDAGDLGVVKLDCYHVERKEELFGLKHGEHTMLVDGYDRAARRFHGVDSDASDSAHYRPVTIGFEEIERACAGYEAFFDPRGTQASLLRVSRAAGSAVAAGRSGDLARVAHETYARFLPERRAARAAWLRLGPALASLEDGADAGALVAWKYTIGNLVAAKRLEAHTLGEILRDEPAAASARRMVEALALVHAVLTKLQMTRSRDPHRTRALAARLDEIARLEAAHVEALETRVGGR